jgi:hypothetical protein
MAHTVFDDPDGDSLFDQHDSALAPLSALMQLTRLQLPFVRPQQLEQLQLPHLQQLRADVMRRNRVEEAADIGLFPVHLSHFSSLTHLDLCSDTLLQRDTLPSSLRTVMWRFRGISFGRVSEADTDRLSLQPMLQLGSLASLECEFRDLRADMCHSGLLQELPGSFRRRNHWRGDETDMLKVWYMDTSAAEQEIAGDAELAAAGVLWGRMPLKSVRLVINLDGFDIVKMPKSAVQALGALLLTELAITGSSCSVIISLGLGVTPAELGEVLQRLPLLQHLRLESFAMLCDERAVAPTEAKQQQQQQQQLNADQQQPENQQQGTQPYQSAAAVIALISSIAGLPLLQQLQLMLPLQLQPAAAQQVEAALGQLLPGVDLHATKYLGMWLTSDKLKASRYQ